MNKILFINYLILDPLDVNFRYKYELFSKRYDVSMIHFGMKGGTVKNESFIFYSCPWSYNFIKRFFYFYYFCIKIAWRQRPFKYVIAYDPTVCGLIGLIIARMFGAKVVIEVNSDQIYSTTIEKNNLKTYVVNKIKLLMISTTFRLADGIKFVSKGLFEQYNNYVDFKNINSKIVSFFNYYSTQDMVKSDMGDQYILFVGFPFSIKGVDILIKAFNIISPEYPEVKLKILGHCEDRSFYEELAGNNRNIIFKKAVPFNKIISEFEKCTFFVLPSRTEGLPRVIVEAMASGKAVIASRIGGIPEVVEENKTGLLFESENYSELADKMRQFLDDPEMMQRMGEAGYQRAKNHFSPEKYVELYHEFLESLDGGSAEGRVNNMGTDAKN